LTRKYGYGPNARNHIFFANLEFSTFLEHRIQHDENLK
jgi:hypothetical protein